LGGTTEELALFEVEWKEMVEVEGSSLSTLWRSLREWIRNFAVVLNRGDVGVVFDSYPVIGEVLRAAAFSSVLTLAYALLVGTPVMLGYHRLHLNLIDDSDRSMKVLFSYFKKEIMGKAIVLRLLHTLILFACEIPMLVTYAVVFLLAKENVLPLLAAGSLRQAASVALPWVILLAVVWIATTVLRLWVIYRYKFCYMILAEYPEMRALLDKGALIQTKRTEILFPIFLVFIVIPCGINYGNKHTVENSGCQTSTCKMAHNSLIASHSLIQTIGKHIDCGSRLSHKRCEHLCKTVL
jgi:hypothetical protein